MKEREEFEEKLLQVIEENFAFLTDEFWDEEDEVSGKEKDDYDNNDDDDTKLSNLYD